MAHDDRPERDRTDDGDERDRDRDRAPPRSSNRSTWLILLAVGGSMFLVCSGLVVVGVIWGARMITADMPATQAVADQFFDRLQHGQIDDAYALTNETFRKEQSREQFAEFVKKFETFTRHTSRTTNGFRIFHDGSGKHAFIQMTLHAPNNAMTCTLVLIEEGENWKVEKLTVP